MLIAMRDSPAACGTLGLDMRWFRVGLFALSAGIAGVAGALFAGLRGTIGAADFQFFNSLPLLLLAVVFGVTSVTGATLGGVALMLLPVMQSDHPSIAGLIFAVIGVGAVMLGRDPNGLANRLFSVGRWLQGQVAPRVRERLPVLPGRDSSGGPGQDGAEPSLGGVALVEESGATFEGAPAHRAEAREVPAHAAT
jgi:branched-chain amino acid transport system permease protein